MVIVLSSALAAMFVVVKAAKFINSSEKIGVFKGAYQLLNGLIGNTTVWSNIGTKIMSFGENLVNSGTAAGNLVGVLKGNLEVH